MVMNETIDADRGAVVMELARRRGYIWPAFEIYGGIAGFYDYGPLGSALKANIESLWRNYYVIGEGFAEINCPSVTPEAVFIASGHVEQFTDLMVTCRKCGISYRADHLLIAYHENPDTLSLDEVEAMIEGEDVRCPSCDGQFSAPRHFNLMFETQIGPGSGRRGYLRPETAQAMFLDFHHLYRYHREQLPFGVVQIGRGHRNEISPRQGVIRLREFNMAELEYFVDPADKSHPRFERIADEMLTLIPQDGSTHRLSAAEALAAGYIANETLAYYVALTQRILLDIGLVPEFVRFRQHLETEMAHYADDCWDAESLTSNGWVELVGIADRTAYDLGAHIDGSTTDLTAFRKYDEPEIDRRRVAVSDMATLGPRFRAKAKAIADALAALTPAAIAAYEEELETEPDRPLELELADGETVAVPQDCFVMETREEKVHGERFIPHVIEPSYGVDRILYSLLEHAYCEPEEGHRVLRLPAPVAPIKSGVFPLLSKPALVPVAKEIDRELREAGLATYFDDSGSIGRRYFRMDEIGTPFCVTVDFDTLETDEVTLRERDSAEQLYIPRHILADTLAELVAGTTTFTALGATYRAVE